MSYEKVNEKVRFGQIDLFKFIAALLVITIHTDPLITYSDFANFILTRIISRLAVPFFFISSGYLFSIKLSDDKVRNNKLLLKYINKIFKLYLFSIFIYIPINLYNGYFKEHNSIISFLKDFIFNGTMYHIWYLPALILGMIIVYLLISNLGLNKALIISIVLYIIGLFGDSYYGISNDIDFLKSIYDNLFLIFNYTRNGLFFAPIYIALGYQLLSLYNKDKVYKSSKRDLELFIIFFLLFAIESTVLKIYNLPKHDSMTLFLVPSVYFLFRICLQLKNVQIKSLRQLSLYVYILHPMMIVIARVIGKITKTSNFIIDNSLINYLIVTILSIIVSIVLINIKASKIEKKVKHKKYKYYYTRRLK